MKKVTVSLRSIAPYTQSRQHHVPKLDKETSDAHEVRTWREKCTANADGEICIPAMAFKQALDRAAKMLGTQIPGKGKNTYAKYFVAGVMIPDNLPIGVKKDEVEPIILSVNPMGIRGGRGRVTRYFPQVQKWAGDIEIFLLDDTITREIFEKTMKEAGLLVGVGQYRPENGGTNGRFVAEKFEWSEVV